MKKRGISPLIATVLLIGFTIVLAALVFRWGGNFFQETTQETNQEIEQVLTFTGVEVEILNIRSTNPGIDCTGLEILIENKVEVPIESFTVRVTTEQETKTGEIQESLPAFHSKWLDVNVECIGAIEKIEIFANVLINGEPIVSTDSVATFTGGGEESEQEIASEKAALILPLDEVAKNVFKDYSIYNRQVTCSSYDTCPSLVEGPFTTQGYGIEEQLMNPPVHEIWINQNDVAYGINTDKIYKSIDFGQTWNQIYSFGDGISTKNLWVDSRNTIFVGRGNAGKLYMSLGNDANWTTPLDFVCQDQGGIGYSSLWYMDEDRLGNLYVGEYGGIWDANCSYIHKSSDGGLTWNIAYNGSNYSLEGGRHIHIVKVDPYTDYIYATQGDGEGRRKLIRSTDHGNNWTTLDEGEYSQYISVAITPNWKIFGTDKFPGNKIRRTEDDILFEDVAVFASADDCFIWTMGRSPTGTIFAGTKTLDNGGQNPGLYASLDEGITWHRLKEFGPTGQGYEGITRFSNFDSQGYAYYTENYGSPGTYRFKIIPQTVQKLAKKFDGVNDGLSVEEFETIDNLAISYWFKGTDNTKKNYMLSKGFFISPLLQVYHNTDNNIYLLMKNNASITDTCATSGVNPYDGLWHHTVITYNSIEGVDFYFDGTQTAETGTGCGARGQIDNSTYSMSLGRSTGAAFNGSLAEIEIYNQLLTTKELQSLISN